MFQSILIDLVKRVSGAQWAMLVGIDGVILETSSALSVSNGEVLAAEYAIFYRASQKATSDTEVGQIKGLVLYTDRGKIVLQSLTSEYFLLMGLKPEASTGKAQFEISRARGDIERELVF